MAACSYRISLREFNLALCHLGFCNHSNGDIFTSENNIMCMMLFSSQEAEESYLTVFPVKFAVQL